MADHRLHARRDEGGGDVDGLARVAAVIRELHGQFLALDAARGIDVINRRLHAAAQLFAQRGVGAGERGRRTDQDVGKGRRGAQQQRQQEYG